MRIKTASKDMSLNHLHL